MATALAAGVAGASAGHARHARPELPAGGHRGPAAYLDRLDGVLARADVVKVSADDLAYLDPGAAPPTRPRHRLAAGRPSSC